MHLHLWRRLQGHLAVPLRPGLREQLRVQLQSAAAQRRAPAPDQPQGKDAPRGMPGSCRGLEAWGSLGVRRRAGWARGMLSFLGGDGGVGGCTQTYSGHSREPRGPVLQMGLRAATCGALRFSLHISLASSHILRPWPSSVRRLQ